jgi:hypothetical protein
MQRALSSPSPDPTQGRRSPDERSEP